MMWCKHSSGVFGFHSAMPTTVRVESAAVRERGGRPRSKSVEGLGGLRIPDDLGVKIHKLKHLKLYGKMLLADGVAAIVGSINFAAGRLDDRRSSPSKLRARQPRRSVVQTLPNAIESIHTRWTLLRSLPCFRSSPSRAFGSGVAATDAPDTVE
jgi:hypothetical protein